MTMCKKTQLTGPLQRSNSNSPSWNQSHQPQRKVGRTGNHGPFLLRLWPSTRGRLPARPRSPKAMSCGVIASQIACLCASASLSSTQIQGSRRPSKCKATPHGAKIISKDEGVRLQRPAIFVKCWLPSFMPPHLVHLVLSAPMSMGFYIRHPCAMALVMLIEKLEKLRKQCRNCFRLKTWRFFVVL